MRLQVLRHGHTQRTYPPVPGIAAFGVCAGGSSASGGAAGGSVHSWDESSGEQHAATVGACLEQLARIRTGFGKLVYLASLNKQLANRYERLFNEWLEMSLEEQCQDLERHAYEAATVGMLPDAWLSLPAYSELIPNNALDAQRELYLGNMDLLLDIIRGQAGR